MEKQETLKLKNFSNFKRHGIEENSWTQGGVRKKTERMQRNNEHIGNNYSL